ncbi:MAG: glycosyltransferase family A protein, partial [Verrucomicrobiota bacterium]
MASPNQPTRPPAFSVVIPAYNAQDYLGAAIESVLNQTLPPLEIIVIDDGSTDDTRERLRIYEGRIRYYRQKNQGIGASRNFGISFAKGDWIALLDADDVWHPRKLECQSAVIVRNP